jgi:hypothetical protein
VSKKDCFLKALDLQSAAARREAEEEEKRKK